MAELHRLAASGAIGPKTQVIEEGGSEWRRYAEILTELSPTNPRDEAPPSLPKPATPPIASRRKLTILALGFLYPVGLWMIWRNSDFSKRTKTLVTSICSPIFLLGIFNGPGVIATPVALLLIWVWLGKTFSKVSKIALTAVCTVLFLPMLLLNRQGTNYVADRSPGRRQPTNYASNTSPVGGQVAGSALAKTLGMTPEQFRVAFNARVSQMNLNGRFNIAHIAVEPGAASGAFSYVFSDRLGLVGSVNKASNEIGDFLITAHPDSEEASLDTAFLPVAIIATIDPSISPERRFAVVTKLYRDASANVGVKYSEELGTLKLGAMGEGLTGGVMFFISRKN